MMPKISWKVWLAIGIIALFGLLLLILWWQKGIIDRQQRIEQSMVEMKTLQDGTVRNQAQYVTKKQMKDFAKETGIDLKQIKKDAKTLGADIKGISEAKAVTPGVIKISIPSTSSTPRKDPPPKTATCPDGSECPNPDKHGYLRKTEHLALREPFSKDTEVPWGEVGFNAWKENPWDIKVHSRKYSAVTVLTQNEEGRHFVYSKFSIEVEGSKYTIPVEAKFVEEYPKAKFRFDPSLYLGIDIGTYIPPGLEVIPNLQLFLFSRGQTKMNPRWIFLGLGVGYETQQHRAALMVSPFNYNIGKHLPFVDNIYVGPSVGIDNKGEFTILGGLRLGL